MLNHEITEQEAELFCIALYYYIKVIDEVGNPSFSSVADFVEILNEKLEVPYTGPILEYLCDMYLEKYE